MLLCRDPSFDASAADGPTLAGFTRSAGEDGPQGVQLDQDPGQFDVELEKSNVLILGPTGAISYTLCTCTLSSCSHMQAICPLIAPLLAHMPTLIDTKPPTTSPVLCF